MLNFLLELIKCDLSTDFKVNEKNKVWLDKTVKVKLAAHLANST